MAMIDATAVHIRVVHGDELQGLLPRLCELLVDSVDHGASVGFLAPLSLAEADAYWQRVARSVERGRRLLLVATLNDEVCGTAQLELAEMPNQPHRGSVNKLLVHTSARGRGVGTALMSRLEQVAREAGRWLLVLDTATADADRLYLRTGWTLAGTIPSFALLPDGSLTHTNVYWKDLRGG